MVSDRVFRGVKTIVDKRLFQSPDLLVLCFFHICSLCLCSLLVHCILLSSEHWLTVLFSEREAVVGGDSREERGQLELSLHSG